MKPALPSEMNPATVITSHAPTLADSSASQSGCLDEQTSRHAFRLRVREEGSGFKSAILASGASNQYCASSSQSMGFPMGVGGWLG